uniref:Divergent protein kinase domain 2A n=1 Tax=Eptatretus burgeri TaxID=7764 RepID=A0A8C4R353_EPTBU
MVGTYTLTRVTPSARLCHVARCAKLAFVVTSLVLVAIHGHTLVSSLCRNPLADTNVVSLDRCPACFGTSLCRRFAAGQVTADHPFRLRFFGADVEIGMLAGNREGPRKVVLKRLAAVSEMVALDQDLCLRVMGKRTCNVSFAVFHSQFNCLNESPQPRLLMPEHVQGWSEPVHCPSQRLLDRIVRRFGEARDSGSFLLRHLRPSERVSLLISLAVNPEPLIFQSFPPDEGWPFAKYLGACGRIAVASYVGSELSNFRLAPWEKRVDLAVQALEMAEQLSTNEMDFSLYLLDVRPEAFSVGRRDGRLIATQARRVLIVDRRHIAKTLIHMIKRVIARNF